MGLLTIVLQERLFQVEVLAQIVKVALTVLTHKLHVIVQKDSIVVEKLPRQLFVLLDTNALKVLLLQ